jgi:hypothetical protein
MTGESPLSYQNSKQNTCTCYYLSVTQCKHMRRRLQLVSYFGARCGTSLTSGPRRFASLAVEQEAGWARDTVWTFGGREISLTPTEIRTPGRPARAQVGIPTTLLAHPE